MLAKTGVHHFHGDNNELGTACGRYYRRALKLGAEATGLGLESLGHQIRDWCSVRCRGAGACSCALRADRIGTVK
ncbi:RPL30 [Symbiodinium natans]|uniref:RPL30 protein n=1 Tax=Symbiodinium natans TaxID=878477 RepID=A0A812U7D7_9DINO|nr:RPL30 [Symbiodinium natans]